MSGVFNREEYCQYLDTKIDEVKALIHGEHPTNEELDLLDNLIDLAMILGEQYAYRDIESDEAKGGE